MAVSQSFLTIGDFRYKGSILRGIIGLTSIAKVMRTIKLSAISEMIDEIVV